MKTKINTIKKVIFALVFTTLGASITIVIKKYGDFTIDNELNLLDILSFVGTIILTLYVALILDRSKSNERICKDTIIGYYKDYEANLNERIFSLYNIENLTIVQISSVFKIVRARLYRINRFTLEQKMVGVESKLCEDVFNEITKLWRICTDGRDIKLPVNKDNIELQIINIETMIHELIFEINNL